MDDNFLRDKINEFKQNNELTSIREVAEAIGIAESTIYQHLSNSRRIFYSKTTTKLCNALRISEKEFDQYLIRKGMSPEERNLIKGEVDTAIDLLRQNGKPVSDWSVIDLVNSGPNGLGYKPSYLIPVIAESKEAKGIDDRKTKLVRDISRLDKEIGRLHSPDLENRLRNNEIGNLFEELYLLDLQLNGKFQVPQYTLTTIEDKSGNTIVTKDIIDGIVLKNNNTNSLTRALSEFAVENGDYELVDGGRVIHSKQRRRGEDRLVKNFIRDGEEIPFFTDNRLKYDNVHKRFLDDGLTRESEWVRYRDIKTGKVFIEENEKVNYSKMLKSLFWNEKDNDEDDSWGRALPYRGVEVKKAGSSNIKEILKQLNKQKAAILRHRRGNPHSIAGLVNGIDVVVLNENPKLRKALEDDPFFRYICPSIDRDFRSSNDESNLNPLEDFRDNIDKGIYTRDETILLKKFISRINYEISQYPTLNTIEEVYNEWIARERKNRSRERPIVRRRNIFLDLEYNSNSDENEQNKTQSKQSQEGRLLLDEIDYILRNSDGEKRKDELHNKVVNAFELLQTNPRARITEDILREIFEKSIGSKYDADGSLNSSMRVHREVDGKLITLNRKFGKARGFFDPENVLEKILNKKRYGGRTVDFEDETSIQEFYGHLEELFKQRKKEKELRDEKEGKFSVSLLNCRFSQYKKESEDRYSERFCTYTRLESGILTGLEKSIIGGQIDIPKTINENLAIYTVALDILYNNKTEKDTSKGLKDLLKEPKKGKSKYDLGLEFTSKISKLYEEILNKKDEVTGSDLNSFNNRFRELANNHSDLFNYDINLPHTDRIEFAGRKSIRLDLTSVIESTFLESNIFGEELENQFGIENLMDFDINKQKESMDRLNQEDKRKLAECSNKVRKLLERDSQGVFGAFYTHFSFLEPKLLCEFGRRVTDNSISLSNIGISLSRDYLDANLAGMIQNTEVYHDHYLDQVTKVIERLKDHDTFNSVKEFVGTQEWIDSDAEFIKRAVAISLDNPSNRDKYFEAIGDGRYGDANIIDTKSKFSKESLKRIYSRELNDPHIRYARRMERYNRRKNKDEEYELSQGEFSGLFEAMDKYRSNSREFISLLRESNDLTSVQEKHKKKYYQNVNDLLRCYKELPKESRGDNVGSIFKIATYRGFKSGPKAFKALGYLSENNLLSYTIDKYLNEPLSLIDECGYLPKNHSEFLKSEENTSTAA